LLRVVISGAGPDANLRVEAERVGEGRVGEAATRLFCSWSSETWRVWGLGSRFWGLGSRGRGLGSGGRGSVAAPAAPIPVFFSGFRL